MILGNGEILHASAAAGVAEGTFGSQNPPTLPPASVRSCTLPRPDMTVRQPLVRSHLLVLALLVTGPVAAQQRQYEDDWGERYQGLPGGGPR